MNDVLWKTQVTMIMAQRLVLATQSIRVPPPALEPIIITDHPPTMSSGTTSFSPHDAKHGHLHDFIGKLPAVLEHDEPRSQSPFVRYTSRLVFDIEQPPPNTQSYALDAHHRSRSASPVGRAL